MTKSIAKVVAAVIAQNEANQRATVERIKELEAQGRRIVNGGQTYDGWEYFDYHTKEVLADHTGDLDPDEAWKPQWCHIDRITEDVWDLDLPGLDGVPHELSLDLVEHIADWTERNQDEARAWLKTQAI